MVQVEKTGTWTCDNEVVSTWMDLFIWPGKGMNRMVGGCFLVWLLTQLWDHWWENSINMDL